MRPRFIKSIKVLYQLKAWEPLELLSIKVIHFAQSKRKTPAVDRSTDCGAINVKSKCPLSSRDLLIGWLSVNHSLVLQVEALARTTWQNENGRMVDWKSTYEQISGWEWTLRFCAFSAAIGASIHRRRFMFWRCDVSNFNRSWFDGRLAARINFLKFNS